MARTTSESKLPEVEVIGEKTTSVDIDACLKIFDCVDDTFGASEINKANSTIYAIRGGQRICHARLWAQKIEIVDGDNNLCANGSEGRLRILSDTAIDSYIGTAVEAPATIDGWFYTGDVACLSDEGILDIRFRENPDILTVAGSKIDSKLIEATISSIEGIKRAAVFLSPKTDATNLIAFAVYDKGENRIQLAAHANEAIREKLGAAFMPTRIWPIDAIPVTPFGKVDRNACKGIIRDAIAATAQNSHHLPQ